MRKSPIDPVTPYPLMDRESTGQGSNGVEKRGEKMGKTMQKIKIWNIFDEEKIERGEMFPIEIVPVTTP
jgi:hypothetical protein